MIALRADLKVVLATQPVDFRKSVHTLLAEAAVAYARRQRLRYVVHGLTEVGANVRQMGDMKPAGSAYVQSVARPWRFEWIHGSSTSFSTTCDFGA